MQQLHQTKDPAFEITDVFCIDAEVKIVKCFVGDLAVDISVNQVGGFSSLGFFEEMDVLVGKRHLFKKQQREREPQAKANTKEGRKKSKP